MKKHVTVVPSDRLIIVEGEALQFDFAAPENLHAVQWHNGEGHMEFLDDMNHPLTEGDYAEDVAPFVTAWETEKARLEDEAAAAEAARTGAAAVARVHTGKAELVVLGALLLIGQHLVCFVYFLELIRSLRIILVEVRVARQLAVCLFQLIITCALLYAEHFIIISFISHKKSSYTQG